MWDDERDKQRRMESAAKASAQRLGARRQAQPSRRCPVDGCAEEPRYYSRYCARHADRLRRNGHPTLRLTTKTQQDYADCLKIGRWVRQALTEDEAGRDHWIKASLVCSNDGEKLVFDHFMKHRSEIEGAFGEGFDWHRIDEAVAWEIEVRRRGVDPMDSARWQEYFDWYWDKLQRLRATFTDRVRKLDMERLRSTVGSEAADLS